MYLMIKTSLPCKLAFQELAVLDENFEASPPKVEWEELTVVEKFLEKFYQGEFQINSLIINLSMDSQLIDFQF